MNALKHVTFAAGLALAPVDAGGAEPSGWQALADERAVIRIADAIDRAVDAQDWKLARSYFADRSPSTSAACRDSLRPPLPRTI